jgi:hypothetical protein
MLDKVDKHRLDLASIAFTCYFDAVLRVTMQSRKTDLTAGIST